MPRARIALRPIEHLLKGSILALENGGRILTLGDYEKLVRFTELREDQIERFISALLPDHTSFIAWHPQAHAEWSYVWVPDSSVKAELELKMTDANFIDCDWSSIVTRIYDSRPCMVTARIDNSNNIREASAATWVGANATLCTNGEIKGEALTWISNCMGLSASSIIVAGDDLADAPMLRIVPPRNRVLVGQRLLGSHVDESGVNYAISSDELGNVLECAVRQDSSEQSVLE